MSNIGEVVIALKQGKHARRAGWKEKQMHIYLEDARDMLIGSPIQRHNEPYLVLFTAQQTHQAGWNASTSDLLSDDWEIVDATETEYPRKRK